MWVAASSLSAKGWRAAQGGSIRGRVVVERLSEEAGVVMVAVLFLLGLHAQATKASGEKKVVVEAERDVARSARFADAPLDDEAQLGVATVGDPPGRFFAEVALAAPVADPLVRGQLAAIAFSYQANVQGKARVAETPENFDLARRLFGSRIVRSMKCAICRKKIDFRVVDRKVEGRKETFLVMRGDRLSREDQLSLRLYHAGHRCRFCDRRFCGVCSVSEGLVDPDPLVINEVPCKACRELGRESDGRAPRKPQVPQDFDHGEGCACWTTYADDKQVMENQVLSGMLKGARAKELASPGAIEREVLSVPDDLLIDRVRAFNVETLQCAFRRLDWPRMIRELKAKLVAEFPDAAGSGDGHGPGLSLEEMALINGSGN